MDFFKDSGGVGNRRASLPPNQKRVAIRKVREGPRSKSAGLCKVSWASNVFKSITSQEVG